jgi:zinc protease
VLIKEVTTSPVVCVSIWYRAGNRDESNGTTGLAHLLEHMMFKGTARYGKGVYDDLLEANGGVNNATTWNDRTNYYAIIAKEKVDLAMELEADRMRGALFTESDLEDEMPVVRNEMEKGEDDPQVELDERLGSTAILEHPYHWPTIGWKSDVEAITAEQIHAYYDTYYQPNNAYLVLVGDLPPEVLLEKAVQHFGGIPRGPEPPSIVTVEPPQKGERRFLIRETGNTRLLGIAYRTPEAAHPDSRALEVLGRLLSDGKASRLHKALVETGQAVWVSAYNQPFEDPYLFFVYAMLTEGADADAVEETIYAEIRALAATAPTAEELARVRKRATVETLFSRDDVSDLMFAIGEAEILGGYALFDRYLDELRAVSGTDVQAAVERYCHADARTVGLYLPYGEEGGRWIARPEDDLAGARTDSPAEDADLAGGDGADDAGDADAAGDPAPASDGSDAGADAGAGQVPANPDATAEAGAARSAGISAAAGSAAGSAPGAESGGTSRAGTRVVRRELANGTVLLVRESRENPTVALRARVEGGLLTEPAGKEGIAALVAETLPLGAGALGAAEFAERVESLGIDLSVTAKPDALEIEARCLAEDFSAMVDLLADVVLRPHFEAESFEQARGRQQARLEDLLDDTFQRAYYRGLEELYGAGSAFGRLPTGTEASLSGLTREDAVAYHAGLLQGARWTVAIVGDVAADAAIAEYSARIGAMPAGAPLDVPIPELRVPAGEVPVVRLPMEDRSQVDLVFVGPGVAAGTEGRDAAYVGNTILGGAFTSRLNRALRDDEGLTYWAGSWFEDLGGRSHWVATIGVNPENVEAGLAGVERELRRFVEEGVRPEEVSKAQEYAAGSFPIGLSSKSAVAAALIEAEVAGHGTDYIETYGTRMRAQSEKTIETVARSYADPSRLVVVLAGTFGAD